MFGFAHGQIYTELAPHSLGQFIPFEREVPYVEGELNSDWVNRALKEDGV